MTSRMAKLLHVNKENLIYLGMWILLFLTPILSLYARTTNNPNIQFEWTAVFSVWVVYAIYFIVFIIHNFILAPILIYKNKRLLYLATTICLIFAFVAFQCTFRPSMIKPAVGPPPSSLAPGQHRQVPPEFKGQGVKPGTPGPRRPDFKPDGKPDEMKKVAKFKGAKPFKADAGGRDWDDGAPPLVFGQADIVNTIIIVLLLGMNLGVKLYFKSKDDEEQMTLLETKNLQQQLEFLKFQIHPHFFMNTLNNIHALVDIDPEKSKETILELSKMMRYILYDGNRPFISLDLEQKFLKNYVSIMRLRYTDKVKIIINMDEAEKDKGVPPLMLITFVENAFKHGVSYKKQSFIDIKMTNKDNRLLFICSNSKQDAKDSEHSGIGLANVSKRLMLIYGDDYHLKFNDELEVYTVTLDIPLWNVDQTEKKTNKNNKTRNNHDCFD